MDTACAHLRAASEGRYLGPEFAGRGTWKLLHLCPDCGERVAPQVLLDAALCVVCDHLVVGDAEDPKILVCAGDGGPALTLCADCVRPGARFVAPRPAPTVTSVRSSDTGVIVETLNIPTFRKTL